MKKIVSFLSAAAMIFSLAACSQADGSVISASTDLGQYGTERDAEYSADEVPLEIPESETEGTGNSNVLVAYFSWADNAILAEDVDAVSSPSVIPPGNVQQLAAWVQEETGGDIFAIRVPELVENVANLDQYDTVFLGYPNWWYGVPMALLSFLEQNDLSGKQVYLFCSHGTGGLAGSVGQIAEAAPEAVISDNIFDCYEEEAAYSEESIKAWTDGLGYGSQTEAEEEDSKMSGKRISVQSGDAEVIYELNDSGAADALYEMLPLTAEAEDYSTNEKIFYPPEELACAETPLAPSDTGGGTLAYYEPWGNVVMFYDGFHENPSLYELGYAVSGAEQISRISGTITVEAVE